jgi:hypothetical protein
LLSAVLFKGAVPDLADPREDKSLIQKDFSVSAPDRYTVRAGHFVYADYSIIIKIMDFNIFDEV